MWKNHPRTLFKLVLIYVLLTAVELQHQDDFNYKNGTFCVIKFFNNKNLGYV